MACLWLSGTKKFDSLISGFLCAPEPGDESTLVGSVILDNLRQELLKSNSNSSNGSVIESREEKIASFDSKLLASEVFKSENYENFSNFSFPSSKDT